MAKLKRIKNFLLYHILLHFLLLFMELFPNLQFFNKVRGFIVRPFFSKCGKNFQLARGSTINMIRNISVGDNVYIAHNVWINGTGGLTIGNNVIISPNVVIATTAHQFDEGKVSLYKSKNEPIIIGDGTWISSNSTIVMGVNIANGCLIGANSVLTKSTNPNSFYAGTPAKFIRKLN